MKIKQIKIIATLVLCILAQTAYAQKTQTTLQKENLKGKVKSVYVTDGKSAYVKVNFDETGKITKKENQWSETYRIVRDNYVYDDEGRLISVRIGNSSEFIYTYNPDYASVVFHTKNGICPDCTIIYEYDKIGNCIMETIFSQGLGNSRKYIKRIYNEKNQLIEAFSSHWGPVREMDIRKSDGTEETIWRESEKENHTFYKYNKSGDVSHIIAKTESGKTIENVVITYKHYDKAGNWLELTRSTDMPFDDYYKIYDTYLGGRNITRIIEYYNK